MRTALLWVIRQRVAIISYLPTFRDNILVPFSGVKNFRDGSLKSLTRRVTCEQRNSEPSSPNHRYGEKATSVTYSECMSVALGIQYVMRMLHIVVCGLFGSTILLFLHLISQTVRFSGGGRGGGIIEHKMCVSIFSATSS